jgi:Concanavalin A-like lectin/glucanases superfamily
MPGLDSFTKACFHWNGSEGGAATTNDFGPATATAAGGAQLDTGVAGKFFASSFRPTNAGAGYLRVANFDIDTADFVIDLWVHNGGDGQVMWDISEEDVGNGNCDLLLYHNNGVFKVGYNGNLTAIEGDGTNYDGQPNHCAVIRSNNQLRMFVNGVQEGTTLNSVTDDFSLPSGYMTVGAAVCELGNFQWTGNFSELRISVGTDRGWFSGFAPPSEAYSVAALPRTQAVIMG